MYETVTSYLNCHRENLRLYKVSTGSLIMEIPRGKSQCGKLSAKQRPIFPGNKSPFCNKKRHLILTEGFRICYTVDS